MYRIRLQIVQKLCYGIDFYVGETFLVEALAN